MQPAAALEMQPTAAALPEDEASNCCGCSYKMERIPSLTKKVGLISIVLHIVGFLIGHVPFFVVNFSGPEWCMNDMCAEPQADRRRLTHENGYEGWQNAWCSDRQECRDFVWPDEPGSGSYKSDDDWEDTNELQRQACLCASQEECMADNDIISSCTQLDGFLVFVAVPTVIIWIIGLIAGILMLPNVCGCDKQCSSCAVVALAITAAVLHGGIGLVEALIFWVSGLSGDADWVAGLLLLKNLMCLVMEIVCAVVACGVKGAYVQQADRRRLAQQQQFQMQQMQQLMAMGIQPGVAVATQPGMPMQPIVGQPAAGVAVAQPGPSPPVVGQSVPAEPVAVSASDPKDLSTV